QNVLQLPVRRGEHVLGERVVEVPLLGWGEPALPGTLHPEVRTPVPVLLLDGAGEVPAAVRATPPDTPVPIRGDLRHLCFPFRARAGTKKSARLERPDRPARTRGSPFRRSCTPGWVKRRRRVPGAPLRVTQGAQSPKTGKPSASARKCTAGPLYRGGEGW